MPCGCSGEGVQKEPQALEQEAWAAHQAQDAVLVEYIAGKINTLSYTPPERNPTGITYSFGDTEGNRIKYIKIEHVQWFLDLNYGGGYLFKLAGRRTIAPQTPIRAEPMSLSDYDLPSMEEYAREARAQVPVGAEGG